MRSYPDWLHAELLNWSAWCWSGDSPAPRAPERCASAEYRYQAPATDSERGHRLMIDAAAAEHVDLLWRGLPPTQREALRLAYPQRRRFEDWAAAARTLGMRPDGLQHLVNRAAWNIAARLNREQR